jgi:hypothetical protein
MVWVGVLAGCQQDHVLGEVIAVAGNGVCEPGETPSTDPDDCPYGMCGNNFCDFGESMESCAQDCNDIVCGNGRCESNETPYNCADDCALDTCGNGICEGTEADGCPQDCFPVRCGNMVCEITETNENCPQDCPSATKLDLLFVIDGSGSMRNEQEAIQTAFGSFLTRLADDRGKLPDMHVGVITPDLGTGQYTSIRYCEDFGGDAGILGQVKGQNRGEICFGAQQRYLVNFEPQTCNVHRDATGFCVAHDCIQQDCDGAAEENETLSLVTNAYGCPRCRNYSSTTAEALQCYTEVGTDSCGFEQPLEAMRMALDEAQTPENKGFFRHDALLAVLFLTDEDDCSASRPDILFNPDPNENRIDSTLGFLHSFRCFEFGVTCDVDDRQIMGPRNDCRPREDAQALLYPISRYVAFLTALQNPGRTVVAALAGPVGEQVIVQKDNQQRPEIKPSCVDAANEGAKPAVRIKALVSYFGTTEALEQWAYRSVCAFTYQDPLKGLATYLKTRLTY